MYFSKILPANQCPKIVIANKLFEKDTIIKGNFHDQISNVYCTPTFLQMRGTTIGINHPWKSNQTGTQMPYSQR
jgi:hypothetical protein